ncbi:MAG: (d)CMP kinase, partial [Vallitaleaceae bacterium]|nr:(d)CMP kinase [Vallitaleaceae bacterium]
MKTYSIAIDGPAGAGKSTIAKGIAKELGFIYVDTGAMYRAVGLLCLESGIDAADEARISKEIEQLEIIIEYLDGEQQVIMNDENVTKRIRSSEVSWMASSVSVHPCVRLKMVDLQRKLAERSHVVMDGRDIGTYVLPNASLKIYLVADVSVRADRRWQELKNQGIEKDLNQLTQEIIERDERDMNRDFAPLKKADDANLVDTSLMTIDEVIYEIIK